MSVTLSNQPKSGETYYGIRLYSKDGKYIGSHNGTNLTKRINWFIKDFIDMFIDELTEKTNASGVKVVIDTKTY